MDMNEYKKHYERYIGEKNNFNRTVQKEIEIFKSFMEYIKDIYPFEMIGTMKAYLIFRFENSKNESISPLLYYCEDGYIRFAVFNKDVYQAYNREVMFETEIPFAVVPLDNVMQKLSLSDLVSFIINEMEKFEAKGTDIKEETDERMAFIEDFTNVLDLSTSSIVKNNTEPSQKKLTKKDEDVIRRLKKIKDRREFFGDSIKPNKNILDSTIVE